MAGRSRTCSRTSRSGTGCCCAGWRTVARVARRSCRRRGSRGARHQHSIARSSIVSLAVPLHDSRSSSSGRTCRCSSSFAACARSSCSSRGISRGPASSRSRATSRRTPARITPPRAGSLRAGCARLPRLRALARAQRPSPSAVLDVEASLASPVSRSSWRDRHRGTGTPSPSSRKRAAAWAQLRADEMLAGRHRARADRIRAVAEQRDSHERRDHPARMLIDSLIADPIRLAGRNES